jgi:cardiolipin-specific phospholipase
MVLSYIPYLQQAPTHTHTGALPLSASNDDANMTVAEGRAHDAAPVTTSAGADPYGPRQWTSTMVKLRGKNRALNEFSVERVGEPPAEDHLVIMHGYGAGLGFFYKNFEGLSRTRGWKLWALDLLGMGRSSRPPFTVRAREPRERIAEVEGWFVDALEEWRVQRGLDKFTLLGHSLGGYMAVAYALKYPGRLNKLILASPVGIPEDPYAVNAPMPDASSSSSAGIADEFTHSQDAAGLGGSSADPNVPDPAQIRDNNNFLNARSKAASGKAAGDGDGHDSRNGKAGAGAGAAPAPPPPPPPPPPRRPFPKLLTYLWDANVSPFSIVRWSGPLGPRFVSGWTSRRFSQLPPDEAQALHTYAYSLFRLRGSGEYALSYVLAPGAYARHPLIRRIHQVGRQWIPIADNDAATAAAAAAAVTAGGGSGSGSGSGDTAGTVTTITTTTSDQSNNATATTASSLKTAESQSSLSSSSSSRQQSQEEQRKKKEALMTRETGIPVVLMYGEHDWMDIAGGFAAAQKLNDEHERVLRAPQTTDAQRRAENGSGKVLVVQRAGHHLYLDGWEQFNELVRQEMEDVTRRRKELAAVAADSSSA